MGLDNGIIVKMNTPSKVAGLDRKLSTEYKGSEYYEVCYWRKCWGVRNKIVNYLRLYYNSNMDIYEWKLNIENVKDIISILNGFNDKKVWNSESESIWEWKSYREVLCRHLCNLNYLLAKMEDFEDSLEVKFYDSY